MSTFAIGQRWISEPEPELGLGTVMETGEGRVQVLYPATSEVRVYTEENAPLRRVTFRVGESIEDYDLRFTVTSADQRKIKKNTVRKID